METNEEVVIDTETNEGEGQAETISLSKSEYEKLNQTLGSYKRELKDLKKASEKPKEENSTQTKPDDAVLQRIEKLSLTQANITHSDDVELARSLSKKWNMNIEEVLGDEDFKAKLERQQTKRNNEVATSGIRGGNNTTSNAKETLEYWQGKGVPPTPEDIPNKAVRQKIVSQMISAKRNNKSLSFYNDPRVQQD